jgi:hypothetical protein
MPRSRKPRRRVYIWWIVVSALVTLVFAHGVPLPVFFGLYFIVWLIGVGLLALFFERRAAR